MKPEATPFEKTADFTRFTESMKRLIRVPKHELDEKLKQTADRKARAKAKK